jgi:hypothetical protein
MQQKRQQVLLAILGVLVVVFLLWTFVFKSGDSGGGAIEEPTVTTVATAQTPGDVVNPSSPADPAAPAESPLAETPVEPDLPFNPTAYRDPFARP